MVQRLCVAMTVYKCCKFDSVYDLTEKMVHTEYIAPLKSRDILKLYA